MSYRVLLETERSEGFLLSVRTFSVCASWLLAEFQLRSQTLRWSGCNYKVLVHHCRVIRHLQLMRLLKHMV